MGVMKRLLQKELVSFYLVTEWYYEAISFGILLPIEDNTTSGLLWLYERRKNPKNNN